MILHVYNNPTGTRDHTDGINVWVTDVPPDFTDADVKYNVELWARDGDTTAQLALDLVNKNNDCWLDMGRHLRGDFSVRVYLDE